MTSPWIVPDWPVPAGIGAISSTRLVSGVSLAPFERCNLGARSGEDPAAVATNRAGLSSMLDLPSFPHWLQQVHGTDVLRIDAALTVPRPLDDEPRVDAAISHVPGVVLAVLSADCLPVLFARDDGAGMGAAHAGWRGLAAGVLEATVSALGDAPERLMAWLGPAAGPAAYEVGEEVRAAFVDVDPAAADAFVATRPGHWHVDLYALARQRLRACGIERIHGGDHCTISDRRFYSHRREGRTGRMASLIWLRR